MLSNGLFTIALFFYCGVGVVNATDGTLSNALDRCSESLAQLQVSGNYFSFVWTLNESECELLFQDQAVFTRYSAQPSFEQPSRKSFVRGTDKEYLAVFQKDDKFAHVNSMIQTGNVSPREYVIAESDLVNYLFGFVSNVKAEQTYYDVLNLIEFFRSPETVVSYKKIDDVEVTTLKRETKTHTIELSLAPELGWSIKQIIINYVNGDAHGITKRQFDASRFEKREGVFLPNELTVKRTHSNPDRELLDLSWYLKDFRTKQDGDLGFGKALSEVPDHSTVTIQDALHLSPTRTIEEGKIVIVMDEIALRNARGHKFMPGPNEPRFWLLSIGIILLLVSGGKLIYDHFKKKKDEEE